jgi:hypothetical protein
VCARGGGCLPSHFRTQFDNVRSQQEVQGGAKAPSSACHARGVRTGRCQTVRNSLHPMTQQVRWRAPCTCPDDVITIVGAASVHVKGRGDDGGVRVVPTSCVVVPSAVREGGRWCIQQTPAGHVRPTLATAQQAGYCNNVGGVANNLCSSKRHTEVVTAFGVQRTNMDGECRAPQIRANPQCQPSSAPSATNIRAHGDAQADTRGDDSTR